MTGQLPKEQFDEMRKELEAHDSARDELINHSRGLLKSAKRAIYLVHQGKLADAKDLVSTLKKEHSGVEKAHDNTVLTPEEVGAYRDALEEYVEAACFVEHARGEAIPTRKELGVPAEQYLAGLSDLTGELMRRAVHAATRGEVETVGHIRDFVDSLHGELLQFTFRNSALRRKFDAIKYNLEKVERTLYEVSLRRE